MPDTFFRNEKQGRFHNIIQPNLYVRVYPDGNVLYSIRVSLTAGFLVRGFVLLQTEISVNQISKYIRLIEQHKILLSEISNLASTTTMQIDNSVDYC